MAKKLMCSNEQLAICRKYRASPKEVDDESKVGIAIHTLHLKPLNGLRHVPEGGTCGWYIWGGAEAATADDFYSPLHVSHLASYAPDVMKYLCLPPGYRFLTDGKYEDVWFDEKLLAT